MSTMSASPRIAIVGAGIGGLATAIALRIRGFHADVFEAAETLRPVGAADQSASCGPRLLSL